MKRRKKHYRRKQKIALRTGILIGGILIAGLICFVFLMLGIARKEKQAAVKKVPAGVSPLPQQAEEPKEQTGQEKKEYDALPPRYYFTTDETTVYIAGLKREYTLAWVSDLHMISNITPAEDFLEEHLETILPRYDYFKTGNGIHSVDLWPEVIAYLNYHDFDGVIFGGDLIDYCSRSNIEILRAGFEKLNKKWIYIRADHDYGAWYGGDVMGVGDARKAHAVIDGDMVAEKVLEFDEFVVVGINDSTADMNERQYEVVSEYLDGNKPVVIATHVPYRSYVENPKPGVNGKASLEALSMQVRNKLYYWGTVNYIPHGFTVRYFDRVYSVKSHVMQVLAGHMHHNWEGMITDTIPEHIFSPGFEGAIGIIHIKPKLSMEKNPRLRNMRTLK